MILQIFSKLVSESLLSLYPVFVKNIKLPLNIQLWSRFITYIFISFLFIDYKYIINIFFSYNAILLSIITIIHVYSSYRGFILLESGIAMTIFYIYPIIIIFVKNYKIKYIMFLALIGVYLLTLDNKEIKDNNNKNINNKDIQYKEFFQYEGVLMMFIAALTEALIYFIVNNIKTNNNWNHMFISYFLGALLLTIYLRKDIINIKFENKLSSSLIINGIIGLFGYLLRFFAMSNLDVNIYAPLSYFGVFMAYIYGIIFNNEKITLYKILGTLFIIIPNFLH
jgi:drug/metabolite transporter (DMT)-like permease